ncbi:hypothetical protein CMK11_01555 [Candidatus Poribacteria bacterium]|nr:hypothetical protein [Candidatus Poribacteria bacterium]
MNVDFVEVVCRELAGLGVLVHEIHQKVRDEAHQPHRRVCAINWIVGHSRREVAQPLPIGEECL